MIKFYVAGPMSNLPQCNFPSFDEAAKMLRDLGYDVISPAEMDREMYPEFDFNCGQPKDFNYTQTLLKDLKVISICDAVFLLEGWEDSPGARAEVAFARAIKLPCIGKWFFEEGYKL